MTTASLRGRRCVRLPSCCHVVVFRRDITAGMRGIVKTRYTHVGVFAPHFTNADDDVIRADAV